MARAWWHGIIGWRNHRLCTERSFSAATPDDGTLKGCDTASRRSPAVTPYKLPYLDDHCLLRLLNELVREVHRQR
jgi:hypothetical protein